jgi:hypothetical protein
VTNTIAGNLRDEQACLLACLFMGEELPRLPELGASMSDAAAIGVIVGTGADHDHARAFKLIPLRATVLALGEVLLRSTGRELCARGLRRKRQ